MSACEDISVAVCLEMITDIFVETWGHFPAVFMATSAYF